MEALMIYETSLAERGFKDDQYYTVKISPPKEDRISIEVDFHECAKALSKDKFVETLSLSLTIEEAEKFSAALNTILHHPVDKGKSIEWENKEGDNPDR